MEPEQKTEHRAKSSFFGSMPPKIAFIFGAVSATAVLSIAALIIILPMSFNKTTKTTGTQGTTGTTNTNTAGATATADITKVDISNSPYIGDKNAPVTLAFWTDYQCPFCKQFDEATFRSLITQYVDKGKVKVVFKDFSFLGDDSTTAALAARAVWEVSPKNFLAWHEAMYDKQDGENSGWGKKDDIVALTKTISGINADKVAKLMDDNKTAYQKAIDADRTEGSSMGVNGTPGFVIGNQLISGAQPTSTFTAAIDAELAK